MKWLQPYMEDKIKELGKKVIVYPISFTVDNSETLGELVLEYGELAIEHKIKTIDYYYDNIFYNKAIVDRIKEALKDDKAEEFELVFSAHGLTQRVIDKGDLYQKHILANVEFVKEELKKQNINFKKIDLAYQSRVGPMKWLQPYMEDKLKELGKKVIVYPISFTVDNSETLGELVLEYGELAKEHGIKDYRVAKTPNSNYNFIVALKTIYEDLKLK